MTTKIGGIVIDIDARLTSLEKSLAKGERDLKKFEKQTLSSASSIERNILNASAGFGALSGTLAGLGVALGVGAIVELGKSTLEMADDIATAADQALIGVERFQTLRQVFRELEIDGEQFDKVMLRLVTTLGEVQAGTENSATKALADMGIQTRILSGEIDTTDKLLDAIADSAKTFGTEAEFTAAVVEIFGKKAGPQMAAAMRNGSDGIHAMEDDIRRLGTVLTEEQINKLADANESIEKFGQTAQYAFAIFAAAGIDALESVGKQLDWWEDRAHGAVLMMAQLAGFKGPQGSREWVAASMRDPSDASDVNERLGFNISKGGPLGPVSVPKPSFGASTSASSSSSRRSGGGGTARAARDTDTYAKSMEELNKRLVEVQFELDALNSDLDTVAKGYWDAKHAADAVVAGDGAKWSEVRKRAYLIEAESVASLEASLARLADRRADAAIIEPIAESDLVQMFEGKTLEDVVRKQYGDAFVDGEKFKKSVLQQTGEIADAFANMVSDVEGSITGLSDAIKDGDFLGILTGVLGSISSVTSLIGGIKSIGKGQAFADGTDYAPGGVALVGERGPELVHLPRGSKVTPNHSLPWGDLTNRMPEPNPRLFQPVFNVADMVPRTQVEVVPSPYFDAVVDGRADARVANAAPAIVGGASAGTQKAVGRRARRKLPS